MSFSGNDGGIEVEIFGRHFSRHVDGIGGRMLLEILAEMFTVVADCEVSVCDDIAFVTVPGVIHKYAPVKNQNGG